MVLKCPLYLKLLKEVSNYCIWRGHFKIFSKKLDLPNVKIFQKKILT